MFLFVAIIIGIAVYWDLTKMKAVWQNKQTEQIVPNTEN